MPTKLHLPLMLATMALSVANASAQTAPDRLTLDEALALAIRNNRTLATAALQSEKAEEEVRIARTRRFPEFRLESQASQLLRPVHLRFEQGAFGTYPGIGPVPGTDTRVTTPMRPTVVFDAQATQPLSQLRKINLNIRMSEAARELEREALRSTRLSIVHDVKQLYYAILQAESALDASRHSIRAIRELERVVGDRLTQKISLRNDVIEVQRRLAQSELTHLTLSNTLASQKEQLNQLMGRDVGAPFETTIVPETSVLEADLEAAQAMALDMRPDIRQTRLRWQQAEIASRIARADSIPSMSLYASYVSPLNIEGAPRNIASLGVQFQWEPFDWGRRERAVAVKEIGVRQAAHAVREIEDRAVLEINAQFRHLQEARARVRVASLTQDGARETSRIRTNQFRAQAAMLSDVLQATAAQAEADNQFQQALVALWQARADFERAIGQDVTP